MNRTILGVKVRRLHNGRFASWAGPNFLIERVAARALARRSLPWFYRAILRDRVGSRCRTLAEAVQDAISMLAEPAP